MKPRRIRKLWQQARGLPADPPPSTEGPLLGVAYKQGDPPPPALQDQLNIAFEGGAAKAPNVIQKDGSYDHSRRHASPIPGLLADEHTWLWLKETQMGRFDQAALAGTPNDRMAYWTSHIKEMTAGLPPQGIRVVDAINEPLSPFKGELIKQHPKLKWQVTPEELSYVMAQTSQSLPTGTEARMNEWGLESNQDRATRMLDLLDQMPVVPKVLGLQCHLRESKGHLNVDPLGPFIEGARKRGVEHFELTEVDFDYQDPVLAQKVAAQLKEHLGDIRAIVFWHWRDKGHWRPGAAPFTDGGVPRAWARELVGFRGLQ